MNKIYKRDILWLIIPVMGLIGFVLFAGITHEKAKADDISDVNAVIDAFQDAYSNKKASEIINLFYSEAVVAWDGTNGEQQKVYSFNEWIRNTQEYVFDTNERISDVLSNREIHVFRNIAYVVCDYEYRSDTKYGVGVDIFTLLKQRGRWKIVSLQWTGDETTRN